MKLSKKLDRVLSAAVIVSLLTVTLGMLPASAADNLFASVTAETLYKGNGADLVKYTYTPVEGTDDKVHFRYAGGRPVLYSETKDTIYSMYGEPISEVPVVGDSGLKLDDYAGKYDEILRPSSSYLCFSKEVDGEREYYYKTILGRDAQDDGGYIYLGIDTGITTDKGLSLSDEEILSRFEPGTVTKQVIPWGMAYYRVDENGERGDRLPTSDRLYTTKYDRTDMTLVQQLSVGSSSYDPLRLVYGDVDIPVPDSRWTGESEADLWSSERTLRTDDSMTVGSDALCMSVSDACLLLKRDGSIEEFAGDLLALNSRKFEFKAGDTAPQSFICAVPTDYNTEENKIPIAGLRIVDQGVSVERGVSDISIDGGLANFSFELDAVNINGSLYVSAINLREFTGHMAGGYGFSADKYDSEKTVRISTENGKLLRFIWLDQTKTDVFTEEYLMGGGGIIDAYPSDWKIEIGGVPVTAESYLVYGSDPVFKLRDIVDALGFTIDYDSSTQTVILNSK